MFEVSGTFAPAASGLRLVVTVRNVGGAVARDLRVHGQLTGERAVAAAAVSIAPGTSADALLDFPQAALPKGVHALALRLDYESASGATPEPLSQCAYLMLAFGAAPPAAVHIEPATVRIRETGRLPVTMRSTDGRPHRVRLSVHVPRVLGVVPHEQEVDVPATGDARAEVRLYRGASAARIHGLLVVAATEGEEAVASSAATGLAEVDADPAVLPRVTVLLPALGLLLMAASAVAEWRRGVLRSPTV